MADEPNEGQGHVPAKVQTQEVPITELGQMIQQIMQEYGRLKLDELRLENEYDLKALEVIGKQNRTLIRGLLSIVGAFVVFAGYLIFNGREEAAIDLIQLVAAVAGAALGGYGLSALRRGRSKDGQVD